VKKKRFVKVLLGISFKKQTFLNLPLKLVDYPLVFSKILKFSYVIFIKSVDVYFAKMPRQHNACRGI